MERFQRLPALLQDLQLPQVQRLWLPDCLLAGHMMAVILKAQRDALSRALLPIVAQIVLKIASMPVLVKGTRSQEWSILRVSLCYYVAYFLYLNRTNNGIIECFCDKFLYNGAAPTDESKCQMDCSGNAAEKCGGPGALSLYHTGTLKAYAAPTAQKKDLPGSWVYQGCYSDNVNDKRALFWQSILTTNNTATSCLSLCADYGYMAAGL